MMEKNGCEKACNKGSELCWNCMSPEEIEAERRAEESFIQEQERGIVMAEHDFEEDSDFALRTRPQ